MTSNVSTGDRVFRLLIGIVFVCAAWVTWPGIATILSSQGIVSLAFLVVGIEVAVTGLIAWSPMYALCGFSTKEKIGA